jgi:hypothetical protein
MAEKFSLGHAQMICNAFKTAYANGVIGIFGGASQPADANDAETGTLLALITLANGAFTPGNATNGLEFDSPVNGVLPKAAAETWSGLGLAAAGSGVTATYFRFYANAYVTGASTTAVRYDGAISTSSLAELQMGVTTVVQNVPVVISAFNYTPPRI